MNLNLCGGIINTHEPEMLLAAVLSPATSGEEESTPPLNEVDESQRHRSDLAMTTSPNANGIPQSDHPVRSPTSPFLNPLSKEDLKKSWSRPLCSPLNKIKTLPALLNKLEAGFNLVSFLTKSKPANEKSSPQL